MTQEPARQRENMTIDELVEQIRDQKSESQWELSYPEACALCQKAIDEAVKAAIARACEPKWISVEEELPEFGDPVEFIFRGKSYLGTYEVERSTWEEPYYEAKYWDTDGGEEIMEDEQDQVTHWKPATPLPQPPETK